MVSRRSFLRLGVAAVAAAACDVGGDADVPGEAERGTPVGTSTPGSPDPGAGVLIEDVAVFDGERHVGSNDVLIRGDRIEAVGPGIDPGDVQRLPGTGRTLLPGLIDAHTHTSETRWTRQALLFGVTTLLDMLTHPALAERFRDEQEQGGASGRADVLSAGYAATTPGGHGTQYGLLVPTLTAPEQAADWVEDRIEEGSDYIKIIVEDSGDFDPLPPAIVEALVEAAHDRGMLTVAHAMRAPLARQVIGAGVDGLAHVLVDGPADDALLDLAVERGVFMITTLSVVGASSAASIVGDPQIRDWLRPSDIAELEERATRATRERSEAGDVVARFHRAGLRILAGSDARNPGVVHGASLHGELETLVAAGLEPEEALAAATVVPAAVFGLHDRGRITPGRRADLLLVNGDPTEDITATRDVAAIWKEGARVDRDRILDLL